MKTLILLLLLSSVITPRKLYVDYVGGNDANSGLDTSNAWKKCVGMQGFSASYTHAVGDSFIFKGGVTWPNSCFKLYMTYSGSADHYDYYGVDSSWYALESFSRPTFDGENGFAHTDSSMIRVNDNMGYFVFDNINMINVGDSAVYGGYCIRATSTLNGVVYKNLRIKGYSSHGITNHVKNNTPISVGMIVDNCEISNCANAIEMGTVNLDVNDLVENVRITNCWIHDEASQLIDADHGDGIHIFANSGGQRVVDKCIIAYNTFDGDWGGIDSITSNTAQVYFEAVGKNVKIYNNSFSCVNDTNLKAGYMFSPGIITASADDSLIILNNTFHFQRLAWYSGFDGVATAIKQNARPGAVAIIKGNTITGVRIGITIDTVGMSEVICDYNCVLVRPTGGYYGAVYSSTKSFAQWQALGFDVHGLSTDPLYLDTSGTYDLHLSESSPAVSLYGEQFKIYDDDIEHYIRPVEGNWSSGAFEYNSEYELPLNCIIGTINIER